MAELPGWVGAGLLAAAALLAGGVWAARRLGGPVFGHELRVLARRGTQFRLRVALVGVLLAVLLLTYAGQFGWDAVAGPTPQVDPRSGRFAERFAVTVLAVQLLAVVALAPAVVGGAVTEERDRGTLDLLRTTALSDREIAVGKLLARLAVVGGVAAAGLPVLALTLLFGGVDPRRLAAGYAVTAGAGFGLGAASLYLGTVRDGLRAVLATVYAGVAAVTLVGASCWLVPGLAGLSPGSALFAALFEPDPFRVSPGYLWWHQRAWPAVFALVYVGGGAWLTLLAVGRVRTATVRRSDDSAAVRLGMRRFYVNPLGDADDPLVWQELEFGGRRFGGGELRFACGAFALFVAGAGLFVGLVQAAEQGVWVAGAVGRAVRPVLAAAAVLLPLGLGLRLTGSLGRERDRQTLDALLLLPGDRRQILRAKLLAAVWWGWWAVALVSGLLALSVVVGGIWVLDGILTAAHLLSVCGLAVGLAAWLGVTRATGYRATVLFLVGQLVVVVGPPLLVPLAGLWGERAADVVLRFCPPEAVWRPGIDALLPAGLSAVAGWLLWRAAGRRLAKEPARGASGGR